MLTILATVIVSAVLWREAPSIDAPIPSVTTEIPSVTLKPMDAQVKACIKAAWAKAGVSKTLQQAMRTSKPENLPIDDEFLSKDDARTKVAYYEASMACRLYTLDYLMEHAPILIPSYVQYFESIDRRTEALVRGEISWADAARDRQRYATSFALAKWALESSMKKGKTDPFTGEKEARLAALRFLSKGTLTRRVGDIVPPPPYQECSWRPPDLLCPTRVIR